MRVVFDLIEQIKQAENVEEIDKALAKLANLIEFDYFLLGMATPSSITKSDICIIDNYPDSWRKHYDEAGFSKHDPIVHYCMANYSPVLWSHIESNKTYAQNSIKIMKEAKLAGLDNGFSIPIHSASSKFGMISFASSDKTLHQAARLADAIPIVQLAIPAIQDALRNITVGNPTPIIKLTKRESECLTWATEGKSSWEISQILGCAERTVIFHLTNATVKLDSTNRYQAISKAILSGVIIPSL